MYLIYLLIIIGFSCYFSLPYKLINIILQGNYAEEISCRPDMAFSLNRIIETQTGLKFHIGQVRSA